MDWHSRSYVHFVCFIGAAASQKTDKDGKEEDYKGESKFASHLKSNKGVSEFARTRTLKEQREYLPAFAVREELLKIIRENQGIFPRFVINIRLSDGQSSSSLEKLAPERRRN